MGRKKLALNRAELILQAAAARFAEVGYDKTTLDEIAESALISKGSIYLEFDSKESILITLIERNKDRQLQEMRRLANSKSRSEQPVLDILKAMLVQHVGSIYDGFVRHRLSPEAHAKNRQQIRAHIQPFFDARLALITELLKKAAAKDEIRPITDYRHTAHLIMRTLRAVLAPYEPNANKVRLQNEASEILTLILNGLR